MRASIFAVKAFIIFLSYGCSQSSSPKAPIYEEKSDPEADVEPEAPKDVEEFNAEILSLQPPTDFRVSLKDDSSGLDLSWRPSGDEDGFILKYKKNEANWEELAELGAGENKYFHSPETMTATHRYRLVATSSTLPNSSPTLVTFLESDAPPKPITALVAEAFTNADNREIVLSWQDNSEDETGFEVQAGFNGQEFATSIVLDANVTSVTHQDLIPGTTYHYRVFTLKNTKKSKAVTVQAQTDP